MADSTRKRFNSLPGLLNARREKRTERAADGDGRQGFSMSLQREQEGRQSTGDEDERAKGEVSEIVFHDGHPAAWTVRAAGYCNRFPRGSFPSPAPTRYFF